MSYTGGASSASTIYVCNLPSGTDEMLLAEHFGTIGLLKKDKRTGRPKIWMYRDKVTNEPKGDATVTYEDPHAAVAAVEWFNNKDFHGTRIGVFIAESKNKEPAEPLANTGTITGPTSFDGELHLAGNFGMGESVNAGGNIDDAWTVQGGKGKGQGELGRRAWQQEGDWLCPNPSCTNVNFAFRGVCNRCGTARPVGSSKTAGGGMGVGRGRGRRGDTSERGRGPSGPPGLFGPNDWTCPMCGNINWAKRTKCNICNTTKPGHNEGGAREGRAGGYKEYDQAEIEETKRRRREAEEDDGEMYDEFGNLKKKFRAKAKQNEVSQSQLIALATGKAGWDDEELGVIERDKGKGKERGHDLDWDRMRDRDEYNEFRSLRDDELGNDYEKDGGQDRGRERDRHEREREKYVERDYDSYNKERSRDRGRDWERDRGRGRDRENERARYHDNDLDRERDWSREREHARERDRF
eukprot:c26383_g1_i1 orf=423-1823(-)